LARDQFVDVGVLDQHRAAATTSVSAFLLAATWVVEKRSSSASSALLAARLDGLSVDSSATDLMRERMVSALLSSGLGERGHRSTADFLSGGRCGRRPSMIFSSPSCGARGWPTGRAWRALQHLDEARQRPVAAISASASTARRDHQSLSRVACSRYSTARSSLFRFRISIAVRRMSSSGRARARAPLDDARPADLAERIGGALRTHQSLSLIASSRCLIEFDRDLVQALDRGPAAYSDCSSGWHQVPHGLRMRARIMSSIARS